MKGNETPFSGLAKAVSALFSSRLFFLCYFYSYVLQSIEVSSREFAEQAGESLSHSDVACEVAGALRHFGHVAETYF